MDSSSDQGGYQPAFTPGSQGRRANEAFSRQTMAAGKYSRENPVYAARRRRSGRGKKIAIAVIVAVLVVVIGAGTAAALYLNSINDQLNRGSKSSDELSAIKDALTGQKSTSFNQPFYMMLIGSDQRVGDDASGARSDTNIVVRIDPTTNTCAMVSIPRDTKIDIDGYGTNKFNAAYSYDGAAGAIREANQLCGVDISHYAEVNFDELVSLVDAVGGVDIDVEQLIDDTDADGTTDVGGERIIIQPGMQHMDGKTALVFARSRAYVDGDFTRTANQRKLIKAIVDKVLQLPVTELPGVVQAAAKSVTTDLSVTDIVALAQQFKDGSDLTLYSAMLPSTTATIDGVSYVINDPTATKEMMKVVGEGGDPSTVTVTPEAYAAAAAAESGGSSAGSTSSSGGGSGSAVGPGGSSYGYDPYYSSGSSVGSEYGYGSSSQGSSGYDSSLYYDSGSTSSGAASGYGQGSSTGAGTGVSYGTGSGQGYGTGAGSGYVSGYGY